MWEEIAEKSPEMIEQTLIGLTENTINPQKQCEDGVCIAGKLTKDECLIDWTKTNTEIHNLVRGICRCPSAYFKYNDKIIKVIETIPIDGDGKAGEISKASKDGVDVGCGKGIIRLLRVKPEGKGEMNARDWYNGVRG